MVNCFSILTYVRCFGQANTLESTKGAAAIFWNSTDATAKHPDMISAIDVLGQAKLVKQLLGRSLGVVAEVGHAGQKANCTRICVLTSCAQWRPWTGTP